jgi:hypothetical protein
MFVCDRYVHPELKKYEDRYEPKTTRERELREKQTFVSALLTLLPLVFHTPFTFANNLFPHLFSSTIPFHNCCFRSFPVFPFSLPTSSHHFLVLHPPFALPLRDRIVITAKKMPSPNHVEIPSPTSPPSSPRPCPLLLLKPEPPLSLPPHNHPITTLAPLHQINTCPLLPPPTVLP